MYLCLFNEISLKEHLKWHKTIWNRIFTHYHRLMKSLKLRKWFIISVNCELYTFQPSPNHIYFHSFGRFIYPKWLHEWCILGFANWWHCLVSVFCILQEERILGTGSTITAQTDSTSQSVQMPLNHTLRVNMIHLSVWALRPGSLSSHQRDTSILPLSLSLPLVSQKRAQTRLRDYVLQKKDSVNVQKGIFCHRTHNVRLLSKCFSKICKLVIVS